MGGGGEDGHVGADLGDDVLGADRPDTVDLIELPDLGQVGFGQLLDPGGERLDLGGVVVDGDQHHRQHGGVLIGEEGAFQRLFQPADLAAHRAAGQLRQCPGVALPGGEPVEHVPARGPVNVGDHAGQLQVPVFQQFLHPLLLGGAGLGEVAAVAGVGAEPADRLGRHETGGDHPPLGDLGEPDGVGPVGFRPAGQGLDLRGVVQIAIEPARFQHEEHRFPVVTGPLHADLGDSPAA